METINHTDQPSPRPSASELMERARQTVRSQTPEASAEPTQATYTMEDYVDSAEELKRVKRWIAKAYEAFESGRMAQDDQNATVDRRLISKNRPHWEEHFPKDDSAEELARWQEFVMGFEDPTVQRGLTYLLKVSKRHEQISSDPSIREQKKQYSQEKLEILAYASAYRALERDQVAITKRIESSQATAAAMGEAKVMDPAEIQMLTSQLAEIEQAKTLLVTSEKVVDEIVRRRTLEDKRQLKKGVLMTEQMSDVERKNLPSLLAGEPLLLVGETGGAKTALARHMAQEVLDLLGKQDQKPEVISGFAEINTYQLMGKNELRENGTHFVPGPLVRAMQEGRPVILDEVNAMPADILKRLNIIMQLRPGDDYEIQENNGMTITVQPGFCIIATMNEKSHRYRGVELLSSEYKDRFGSNVALITYPDQDVPPGGDTLPPTLFRLAVLSCTDPNTGEIVLNNMSLQDLMQFVSITHFTQHMYTHPADDASMAGYIDTGRVTDASKGETGLSKSVISPRTMVQIIEKVEQGMGRVSLQEALADFLGRLEDKTDREIIAKLIEDYGLAKSPENGPA